MQVQISPVFAVVQIGHALSFQNQHRTGLRFGRHRNLFLALQRFHINIAAQGRFHEGYRHFAMHIVASALKNRIGADRHGNIQIACRSSVRSVVTLAADHHILSVVNTGRNGDDQLLFRHLKAAAPAGRTGGADDFSLSSALRANTGGLEHA